MLLTFVKKVISIYDSYITDESKIKKTPNFKQLTIPKIINKSYTTFVPG